ncbi:MAG TPA: alpha/beta hydrolase [Holophaga sp.]|nr:alpha/beta hydrolase [Holophaga sp.]
MKKPALSCRPPFWAKGPHVQTLSGHFIPSPAAVPPWERVDLKLSDGDALRIRKVEGKSRVVVHLFHGLGGDADSDYMRRCAALFWSMGHSVMAINHRGAGEGKGLATRPYHMGSTRDMAAMIQLGREAFPNRTHVAIGFSLSANVLLLLLGRDHDKDLALPDRAIAVNPPVDLAKASERMGRGLNRLYDIRFVHMLRRQILERWEMGLLKEPVVFPRFLTLHAFDEIYTAPQGGFSSREDYYRQCSSSPYVNQIQVPTVILSSKDDPFATVLDLDGVPLSSRVHLHAEEYGGHMGYISRGVPGRRWMDYAISHYFGELLASE